MLGFLMKFVVVSYMSCRLTVTKEACNIVGFDAEIFEKIYKPCISQHVVARARYLTSKDDLEIVLCFLVFHDIKESPRKMQKLVVEWRVVIQEAQFESLKALS